MLDLKRQWFVNDMGCNRWKDRSTNARIAKAKFPQIKTIEGFDFSFHCLWAFLSVNEDVGTTFSSITLGGTLMPTALKAR